MTNAQQKDLFTEWALYESTGQQLMNDEYNLRVSEGNCSKDSFLSFLKDRLEIEGYSEKVCLA